MMSMNRTQQQQQQAAVHEIEYPTEQTRHALNGCHPHELQQQHAAVEHPITTTTNMMNMNQQQQQQFSCLYTKQKTQKRKTWSDGRLVINTTTTSTHVVTLHAAYPSPGMGDPILDQLEMILPPSDITMILLQRQHIETELYLIHIEGPWVVCPSILSTSCTIQKNPNHRVILPSRGMQNVLTRKFQKPTTRIPPPPPQQQQLETQRRRRPLQPGELIQQHYGIPPPPPPSSLFQHSPQESVPSQFLHQNQNDSTTATIVPTNHSSVHTTSHIHQEFRRASSSSISMNSHEKNAATIPSPPPAPHQQLSSSSHSNQRNTTTTQRRSRTPNDGNDDENDTRRSTSSKHQRTLDTINIITKSQYSTMPQNGPSVMSNTDTHRVTPNPHAVVTTTSGTHGSVRPQPLTNIPLPPTSPPPPPIQKPNHNLFATTSFVNGSSDLFGLDDFDEEEEEEEDKNLGAVGGTTTAINPSIQPPSNDEQLSTTNRPIDTLSNLPPINDKALDVPIATHPLPLPCDHDPNEGCNHQRSTTQILDLFQFDNMKNTEELPVAIPVTTDKDNTTLDHTTCSTARNTDPLIIQYPVITAPFINHKVADGNIVETTTSHETFHEEFTLPSDDDSSDDEEE